MSPYLRRLRERVGHDLLLLPSVSVLALDGDGRVLLVRHADSGAWGTVGGVIEPDEAPADAARREAREEAGVDVELVGLVDVVGGAGFRVTYPSGDEAAYVAAVYEARVVGGVPEPDGDETTEVGWFTRAELPATELTSFARATFEALGWLRHR